MSSRWTHAACDECFVKRTGRPITDVHRMVIRQIEDCCYCGGFNESGIYLRDDPAVTPFCNHDPKKQQGR